MTVAEALLFGIIQGITEFLPVSSSGHLSLIEYFLGFQNLNNYIFFNLVLHLGTLLAIFVVFQFQILQMIGIGITSPKSSPEYERYRLKQIILATFPLFPIAFLLKPIESIFDRPEFFGIFFLITAAILYAGVRFGYEKSAEELFNTRWRDSLFIGLFQAIAIFPGISRSGSTISAARLAGWDQDSAITFSFLLAIPAILGGSALKVLQVFTLGEDALPPVGILQYLAGFFAAFIVGYGALHFLIRLATKGKFMYFVWYCLVLGAAVSFYFLIKH